MVLPYLTRITHKLKKQIDFFEFGSNDEKLSGFFCGFFF